MGAVTSCDGPVCGQDKDADERKTNGKRRRRRRRSNSTSSNSDNGSTMTINNNGEVTITDGVSPASRTRRNSRTLVLVQAAPANGRRASLDNGQTEGLNIDTDDNSGQTYRTNTANNDVARAVAGTIDGIPALTPIPEEKPGTFTPDPYARPSFRFGRKPSLSQQSSSGASTQRTLVEVEEME